MNVMSIQAYNLSSIRNIEKSSKKVFPKNEFKADSLLLSNSIYHKSIAFEGVSANGLIRQRGMYHHISALPAKGSFCGQFLDVETENFINFLKKAKQTHWIVNPLNQLKEDMCPYNPIGRFSKNKYLVNLNVLATNQYANLLKEKELSPFNTSKTFTLDMLKTQKDPLFQKAYSRFKQIDSTSSLKKEFNDFCEKNDKIWLDAYATYDVVAKKYGDSWYSWDKELITAPEKVSKERSLDQIVLDAFKNKGYRISPQSFENAKNLYKFEQFLFDKQFKETLKFMGNDLKIMTDFPIGVCADGVDTWSKKDIFLLDKKTFKPTVVTGCPSQKNGKPFTQVWGHAQLDFSKQGTWDYLEDSLNQMLEVSDVRLDHFVAYANRANIPTKHIDANGKVLEGNNIFKEEPFGMGVGFFKDEWIENIAEKKNPKNGEDIFQMFIRLAENHGKSSNDAYMIESLGQLTQRDAYIEGFEKKYGDLFTHQRVIFPKNLDDLSVIKELETSSRDFVILTSNHDKSALREVIRNFLDKEKAIAGKFTDFMQKELKISANNSLTCDEIQQALMKWYYEKFNKHHIHTTLMDALNLEGRFNIPGTTNTAEEKYFMSPSPEGLLPLWTQVMPKNYLDKVDRNGNSAGYKDRAEKFIELQNSLDIFG